MDDLIQRSLQDSDDSYSQLIRKLSFFLDNGSKIVERKLRTLGIFCFLVRKNVQDFPRLLMYKIFLPKHFLSLDLIGFYISYQKKRDIRSVEDLTSNSEPRANIFQNVPKLTGSTHHHVEEKNE